MKKLFLLCLSSLFLLTSCPKTITNPSAKIYNFTWEKITDYKVVCSGDIKNEGDCVIWNIVVFVHLYENSQFLGSSYCFCGDYVKDEEGKTHEYGLEPGESYHFSVIASAGYVSRVTDIRCESEYDYLESY